MKAYIFNTGSKFALYQLTGTSNVGLSLGYSVTLHQADGRDAVENVLLCGLYCLRPLGFAICIPEKLCGQ